MSNYSITPALACNAIAIPTPVLFGAEIINVSANTVQNFSRTVLDRFYFNHPSSVVQGVDFCNITVTYTHPGYDDTINVETWLPTNTWNGRLQAIGGGGWMAGRFFLPLAGMAGAIGEGYVATTSDGGLGSSFGPDPWALVSPGNVNLYALQNFASVALNDQSVIAKELIKSFYGRPEDYSYWSGCSQGGRQGMMLAQRFPDAYDGIAAAAPAMNWGQMIPSTTWSQVMMSMTGLFPPKCELDALTDAAVAACDPLDGVSDGIISDLSKCSFDPFTWIGKSQHCLATNKTVVISEAAATVANFTWTGPRTSDGDFLWYGLGYQARLGGSVAAVEGSAQDQGLAITLCSANGTCTGFPTGLGDKWFQLFVKKNKDWSYTDIKSVDEYARLFHASVQEYDSIIGTADADLTAFKAAGGKLLTYHGMADEIIPIQGSENYFTRVNSTVSDIDDFFRYFEVPGLAHCSGGNGGQPTGTFQALVDWVERGIAPKTLPIDFDDKEGVPNQRILCPYPMKAMLSEQGLDATKRESWICA